MDNIQLIYNSQQTSNGEPEVQELNVSQIFDDSSKKLHKQTDRELEGTKSGQREQEHMNTPTKFIQTTPEKGHKRASVAFIYSSSGKK